VIKFFFAVIFIYTAASVLQTLFALVKHVYSSSDYGVRLYSMTQILAGLAYKDMVLGLLNFDRYLMFR
jgi:hypothetical protein